jgi:uncharacterized protein (TIGR02246 family)
MLTPAESLDILQLVTRADACATARDAAAYAALFTEDAVMDGDMGTAVGVDQIRETVARVWAGEPDGVLHLTLNALLDESGPQPAVDSVMLMVSAGGAPTVVGSARVRQSTRPTPAGWKISSRTITA